MKAFISTTTFAEYSQRPLDLLKERKVDFDLNSKNRKLSEKEIKDILSSGSYSGIIAGTEPLTKKVLESAKNLKVISRVGVGMDNVDLEAAKRLKIKVFNTPDVLTDSVAELTLGLMLCCLRKIVLLDRNIRQGVWKKQMGQLLKGKTVGLIGFGRIGQRVGQLVNAFGAEATFFDIKNENSVTLRKLMSSADIISIHAGSKDTLISKKEIEIMKQGVILVNTSRGTAINENDLLNGLKSGKVSAAGLDVFESEPYSGELKSLDNVVMTAHVGSYAKESRLAMEIEAVENLVKGLE